MIDHAPVWLFDGTCMLCSRAVRHTLRHERASAHPIRFVALQSERGRALCREHGLDPDDPESFLFIDQGRVLHDSDGVIALSRHLQGWAGWVRFARVVPRPVRDAAYRWLARHRYRIFGRSKACMVPDPAMRHRFVLP